MVGIHTEKYERRVGVLILRVAREDFFPFAKKKMGKNEGTEKKDSRKLVKMSELRTCVSQSYSRDGWGSDKEF